MAAPTPDLSRLEGVVSDEILEAMHLASQALTRAGVKHALAGGLAVGAYGVPRATQGVGFIVGGEAFEHHEGGIVTIKVPIQVGTVPVDNVSIGPSEAHLAAELESPLLSRGIPVASVEALVYMKLKSSCRKDSADVVELLVAGVDPGPIAAYLKKHLPGLLPKFEALAEEAAGE